MVRGERDPTKKSPPTSGVSTHSWKTRRGILHTMPPLAPRQVEIIANNSFFQRMHVSVDGRLKELEYRALVPARRVAPSAPCTPAPCKPASSSLAGLQGSSRHELGTASRSCGEGGTRADPGHDRRRDPPAAPLIDSRQPLVNFSETIETIYRL